MRTNEILNLVTRTLDETGEKRDILIRASGAITVAPSGWLQPFSDFEVIEELTA